MSLNIGSVKAPGAFHHPGEGETILRMMASESNFIWFKGNKASDIYMYESLWKEIHPAADLTAQVRKGPEDQWH